MVYAVSPTTFVIMGDSLMYVVLPTAAIEFGLVETFGLATSFWIGLALSINRFIRLASNAFAAAVYYRFGVRWPYVMSVALGALTTPPTAWAMVSPSCWFREPSGSVVFILATGRPPDRIQRGTSQMRGRLIGFFTAGSPGREPDSGHGRRCPFRADFQEHRLFGPGGLGILGVIMALRVRI